MTEDSVQLRRLCAGLAVAAAALAAGYLGVAVQLGSLRVAAVTALLSFMAAVFWLGWRAAAGVEGVARAAALAIAGILCAPLGAALLIPAGWPADEVAAVLAAFVALRFLHGPALRAAVAACIAALFFAGAAGWLVPPAPLPHWFRALAVGGGTVATALFTVWFAGPLGLSLRRGLDEALARNRELHALQARLASSERRALLLARASETLVGAGAPEAILGELARLLVPDLADWCTVVIGRPGEPMQRVAIRHRDPAKAPLVAEYLDRFPPGDHAPAMMAIAARGEATWTSPVAEQELAAAAQGPEHLALMKQLGTASVGILPLVARGRILGLLSLVRGDATRPFDADDRALAATLVQRAAVVLDNARLLQDARRAVASRDEVLGFVSHDLNNLLQPIRGVSALLAKKLPDEGRSSPGYQARIIERSAGRMVRLIRDLLDAASLDAGRLSLHFAAQDAGAIARESLDLAAPLADEKGLALESRLPAEPLVVRCDRGRVSQVLGNLLSNAIKFTPAGTVRLTASRAGSRCLFEIRDTGPGIPAEQIPSVFERFWRGRATQTPGTGLGLYIAKGIVEAHGGTIRVQSAPGRGTAFEIALPVDGRPG